MLEKLYHTLHRIDKSNNRWIIILFLTVVSLLYAFMSVHIHNKFMTFGLDLGTFDEAIWKISRFQFPYSSSGCNWLLEDHFQIIFYFLAPLYWIWSDVRIILIAQSIAMVFAGYFIYEVGKKITKSTVFSFGVVFSYLFFIGTQFSILNEVHQITFAPIFLSLLYLSLEQKNWKRVLFCLFFLFIIKEDVALLIGAIGLGMLFKKGYRRAGLLVAIFGIGFFFFLVHFFMPFISIKGVYDHFHFGDAGNTPVEIVRHIIQRPDFFFHSMIYPAVKIRTWFISFFTFGFLPLLSPLYLLIPLLEDFTTRFIYAGPQYTMWGLVNHHAATGAILLAVSSIFSISKLLKRVKEKTKQKILIYTGISLLCVSTISNFIFHGPINSLLKPQFYHKDQWMLDNEKIVQLTPKNASIAAQNNLLPHLTHRESAYRVPYGLNSEYMVFDLHNGPNKYSPLSYEETLLFVSNLLDSKRYSKIFQIGDAMLLKRNYKTDITKSPYYGNTQYCYYSFEEK